MPVIKSSTDIAAHLEETLKEVGQTPSLSGAQGAVEKMMTAWPNNRGIYIQLQKLADFIAKTRAEISSLQPGDVKSQFIPKATDELDAIVEATASATHRIMDAADVIMDAAGKLPQPDSGKVMDAVTSIYEACTFQDITGQRVTKVVSMLKVIEERVDKMMEALGAEFPGTAPAPAATPVTATASSSQGDIDALFASDAPAEDQKAKDAKLLNGPALPGKGHTQADIDAMFEEKK
jgi:chemotaxis protein CheZ